MSATCVGHHRDDPPLPEPGLLLCAKCAGRLRRDLADIIWVASVLDDLIEPSSGGSTSARPWCIDCHHYVDEQEPRP